MSLKKSIIVKDTMSCPFRDDGYEWCNLHSIKCYHDYPNDCELPINCPLHVYSFIQVEKENSK